MWTSYVSVSSSLLFSVGMLGERGNGLTYDAPHGVLVEGIPAHAHDHGVHAAVAFPLLLLLLAAEQRAADGVGDFAARVLDLVG